MTIYLLVIIDKASLKTNVTDSKIIINCFVKNHFSKTMVKFQISNNIILILGDHFNEKKKNGTNMISKKMSTFFCNFYVYYIQ